MSVPQTTANSQRIAAQPIGRAGRAAGSARRGSRAGVEDAGAGPDAAAGSAARGAGDDRADRHAPPAVATCAPCSASGATRPGRSAPTAIRASSAFAADQPLPLPQRQRRRDEPERHEPGSRRSRRRRAPAPPSRRRRRRARCRSSPIAARRPWAAAAVGADRVDGIVTAPLTNRFDRRRSAGAAEAALASGELRQRRLEGGASKSGQ